MFIDFSKGFNYINGFGPNRTRVLKVRRDNIADTKQVFNIFDVNFLNGRI